MMDLYQTWQKQLGTLCKIYSEICRAENIRYAKDICATQDEVVEVERKMRVSIPKSLRDVFLFFSKKIDFYAFLPEEFALPPELREVFAASFTVSLEELLLAEESRKSWVEDCFSNPNDDFDKVWHNKLGFMTVGDGDIIAFDLNDPNDDKRVVYLSHDYGDDDHGILLGETFEEYFSNLLLIGGCGNEAWQMMPFIDKAKGLCADSENADTYRKLIGLTW